MKRKEGEPIRLGRLSYGVQLALKIDNFGNKEKEPWIIASQHFVDNLAKTYPETYLGILGFISDTIKKPLYVIYHHYKNMKAIYFFGDRWNDEQSSFERIVVSVIPFKSNLWLFAWRAEGEGDNVCEIARSLFERYGKPTNMLTHALKRKR